MKIYIFVPECPFPRNVMLLATDIATHDECDRMIAPFTTPDVAYDQSSSDDNDPDLLHYVFLADDRPTFIIAPDHVTDEFVASKFDAID